MKKILKNISFTKSEVQVISFLIIVISSGFAIKYYRQVFATSNEIVYDYSEQDKKFKQLSEISKNDTSGVFEKDIEKYSDTVQNQNLTDNELQEKIRISEDSLKLKKKFALENPPVKDDIEAININTATKEELVDLPGVGESTAEKILAYREEKKGFKTIKDIMNVKGIGKKKFENIKDYIKTD